MGDWHNPRAFTNRYLAEYLAEELYKHAKDPTIFAHFGDLIDKPAPWWRRLWWWVDARYPRIHFGPCNHEECW